MQANIYLGDLPVEVEGALRREPIVGVDTETTGLDWRQDHLRLCQFFTITTGAILLRADEQYPASAAAVLLDPNVTKVFHHAPFDLRFLKSTWGVDVERVGCTKAASKILDPRLQKAEHSLGALLERHLGVAIPKGPVRTSDWGALELTPEQVEYAANDVAYLPALYETLTTRLEAAGLGRTYKAVCDYMPVDASLEIAGVPNPLTY